LMRLGFSAMPKDRPHNVASRQEASRLVQEGLSLTAVGRKMGISRQRVHQLVREKAPKPRLGATLICADCNRPVGKARASYRFLKPVYCPQCLIKHSDVPFHVRLRLLRLAKGWTLQEAGRRCGVGLNAFYYYEHGPRTKPPAEKLAHLLSVFGPSLK
jgi:transcriptional regulator with XRE-family HTH domain